MGCQRMLCKIDRGHASLLASQPTAGLTWISCPGHAGVRGNEQADRMDGKASFHGVLRPGKTGILKLLMDRFSVN